MNGTTWRRARSMTVRAKGVVLVEGDGVTIAVFADGDRIAAVDNRCPHMGFPLHRGSLDDGILTCHWHHARFDLTSGCAFDLFADDVPSYDVRIDDGQVLVARSPRHRADGAFYAERLQRGLDIGVGLIQAKALLGLLDDGQDASGVIATVAEFAARRLASWGEGLVRLTCVANLAPYLSDDTRYLALYYATRQIAAEASGAVPHRLRGALDGDGRRLDELSGWLADVHRRPPRRRRRAHAGHGAAHAERARRRGPAVRRGGAAPLCRGRAPARLVQQGVRADGPRRHGRRADARCAPGRPGRRGARRGGGERLAASGRSGQHRPRPGRRAAGAAGGGRGRGIREWGGRRGAGAGRCRSPAAGLARR